MRSGTKAKLKILAIDDEPTIRSFLTTALEEHYQVITASSGIEGIRLALSEAPDLILLDILMPGDDGIACLEELRAKPETAYTPIIMLTAVNYDEIRAQAYNAGADDYIVKPFRPAELIARIQKKLNRNDSNVTPMTVQLADVVIDLASARVFAGPDELRLTSEEYKILNVLLRRKGLLIQREELESLIERTEIPKARILDAHIFSLRKKLQKSALNLQSIFGAGFALSIKSNDH